jgi:N-acetylmuramoyl-L-alanine amidase
MKSADDAAQMESADGRAKYAAAVTQGIVRYLSAKAPAHPESCVIYSPRFNL